MTSTLLLSGSSQFPDLPLVPSTFPLILSSGSSSSRRYSTAFAVSDAPPTPPGTICDGKDYRSVCPSGWEWGKHKGARVCKRILTPGSTGGSSSPLISSTASGLSTSVAADDWTQSPDDIMSEKMEQDWGTAMSPGQKFATSGLASAMGMGMNAGANAEVGAADLDIELPSPMEPRPEAERFRRSFPEKCVDDYSLLTAWALPGTEHPGLKGPRQMVYFPVNTSKTWKGTVADDEAVKEEHVALRRQMENVCGMSWPCTSQGGWVEEYATLGRNICPVGWKLNSESGTCNARDAESCRKLADSAFEGGKTDKCQTCKDQWGWQHCKSYNSSAGGSTGCVFHQGKCKPKYQGLAPGREGAQEDAGCLGEKSLWFYTPRMKSFFARMCGVHWPVRKVAGKIVRGGPDTDRLTEIDEVAMKDLDRAKQQEFNDIMLQSMKVGGSLFKQAFRKGQSALLKLMRGTAKNTSVHDTDLPGDCERDMSVACPVGWDEDDDEYCTAPPTYAGLCPTRISFATLTTEMKRAASGHCDFAWPCKDELVVPNYHVFL